MNAGILLIPFVFIRYILLYFINPSALKRLAVYAPLKTKVEKTMFYLYQITSLTMIVYLLFLRVKPMGVLFYTGVVVYGMSILLLALSVVHFANPNEQQMNQSGIYKFSRNPMYVAYFIYFLGCVLLTRSVVLLVLLCLFQLATHWVILSEERWCLKQFGSAYNQYTKKVRRYL